MENIYIDQNKIGLPQSPTIFSMYGVDNNNEIRKQIPQSYRIVNDTQRVQVKIAEQMLNFLQIPEHPPLLSYMLQTKSMNLTPPTLLFFHLAILTTSTPFSALFRTY